VGLIYVINAHYVMSVCDNQTSERTLAQNSLLQLHQQTVETVNSVKANIKQDKWEVGDSHL
jgi:hypothetical protein